MRSFSQTNQLLSLIEELIEANHPQSSVHPACSCVDAWIGAVIGGGDCTGGEDVDGTVIVDDDGLMIEHIRCSSFMTLHLD
ncbi:hypothetical protein Tco_0014540 [Tanacetum coccineum]